MPFRDMGEVKQERMRSILAAAAVLAVLLAAGALACAFLASQEAGLAIGQQEGSGNPSMASSSRVTDDPFAISAKQTEVPRLLSLLGLTEEQAVSALGHGATVAGDEPASASEGVQVRLVTVALAAERSDPRAGAPTVYLGLDEVGRVCSARYSVLMESLGYSGNLTFRQALQRVHVVERTLQDAGIPVEEGAVQVPADRKSYSTYGGDGKTLEREDATFGGDAEVDDRVVRWMGELAYNYLPAVDSGNLADSVHIVTVGVVAA